VSFQTLSAFPFIRHFFWCVFRSYRSFRSGAYRCRG